MISSDSLGGGGWGKSLQNFCLIKGRRNFGYDMRRKIDSWSVVSIVKTASLLICFSCLDFLELFKPAYLHQKSDEFDSAKQQQTMIHRLHRISWNRDSWTLNRKSKLGSDWIMSYIWNTTCWLARIRILIYPCVNKSSIAQTTKKKKASWAK